MRSKLLFVYFTKKSFKFQKTIHFYKKLQIDYFDNSIVKFILVLPMLDLFGFLRTRYFALSGFMNWKLK